MAVFHHLLVATDLGEGSQPAVDLAITLALEWQAQLTVVHVLEVPTYAYASDPMLGIDFFTPLLDIADQSLAEALEVVRRKMPAASAVLVRGSPWSAITKLAEEKGADLLVIGTHGHHGMSHLVLGSVAERVVRTATIPVLTVRMPPPARAAAHAAA